MRDGGRRDGWILLLAIAVGMALGAVLALWVAGLAARASAKGQPAADAGVAPAVDALQVLGAFSPQAAAVSLPLVAGGPEADRYPRILLFALPGFSSRQRALLFIRPADPRLCRTLHGTELATHWVTHGPIGICAGGDSPGVAPPIAAVEFLQRRSS